MEREPHHPGEGEQPHESNEPSEQFSDEQSGIVEVAGNDPQAAIEAARSASSRERRADRAQLERYVELGLDPGDAEAVIEFQHMWRQQRAEQAGTGSDPKNEAGTGPEPVDDVDVPLDTGQTSDSETTLGTEQPDETGRQSEAG